MIDKTPLICVADDDVRIRAMLRSMLEHAGYAVVEAEDGLKLMAALRDNHVALAIVDIIMPDQEGLSTIVQIKHEQPNVRILAISGGGSGADGQYLNYALELGADDTLPKPFRQAELIERVRRLIDQPHAAQD